MTGGSVEATLELWASSLRDVKGRIGPLFQQARTAHSAGLFLDALLGPERRKTGWMRAEAAGDPGPWRQQALLGRAQWDAEALRDLVRDYALETLADPGAVLVVDETGFLKQGRASCGVGRQYTGSAGKITNCQIGVFAAYVSGTGMPSSTVRSICRRPGAMTPRAWPRLMCPHEIGFATKPQLARAMIERAMAAGVPFGWVAGDTSMGLARSRWRCAGPARATCWARTPPIRSPPGARRRSWPARPSRSRRVSMRRPGSASPRGTVRIPVKVIGHSGRW